MLNTFEETFEVTEMRTFKHEPFFRAEGGGGGSLFVVLYEVYGIYYLCILSLLNPWVPDMVLHGPSIRNEMSFSALSMNTYYSLQRWMQF